MQNLTKEQQDKVDKFWDNAKIQLLFQSNVPEYFIENYLFSILCVEDHTQFLKLSQELGILKNTFDLRGAMS